MNDWAYWMWWKNENSVQIESFKMILRNIKNFLGKCKKSVGKLKMSILTENAKVEKDRKGQKC